MPSLTQVAAIVGLLVIGGRLALAIDAWVHGRADTSAKVDRLERMVGRIQKQASARWSSVNKKVGTIELDVCELKVKTKHLWDRPMSIQADRPRGNGDDRSRIP